MARGSIRARDYVVVSDESKETLPAQAVQTADGVRLAWILPALAANASRSFTLEEGTKGSLDSRPVSSTGQAFRGNDDAVTVADGKYGLDIHLNGELFTTYHHAANHNKLFLYPVIGPTGKGMTRGYPMVSDIPGEKHDHPHHKSIHVAHGDVNGVDLWSELDAHGYQRHDSFLPAFGAGTAFVSGPVCGAFRSRSYWVSRSEERVVAEEKRVVAYAPAPDARILDIAVTFHATEGPVRFGDTKEGAMLSVRVASSMDADADGTIENAYGGRGETECFGKRAQWMDYAGPVDGNDRGRCGVRPPLQLPLSHLLAHAQLRPDACKPVRLARVPGTPRRGRQLRAARRRAPRLQIPRLPPHRRHTRRPRRPPLPRLHHPTCSGESVNDAGSCVECSG